MINVFVGLAIKWSITNVFLFALKIEFMIIMEIAFYLALGTIIILIAKMLAFHAHKTPFMIQTKTNVFALVDLKLKMANAFLFAQNIQLMKLNGKNVSVMKVMLTLLMDVD